jgi:hypothetical protein
MPISKSNRKIIIPLIAVFIGAISFAIGICYIKHRRTTDIAGLLFLFSLLLCMASITISIVFFIKDVIRKKNICKSSIIYLITTILTIAASFAIVWGIIHYARKTASRVTWVTCGSRLAGLSKTIALYAYEHNSYLPDANQWCDLMILKAESTPRIFICPDSDAVLGESSYALNKYIAGKKIDEVSPDVVLVFDTDFGKSKAGRTSTISARCSYQEIKAKGGNLSMFGNNPEKKKVYKDRWNQAGGPEILTADHHKEGMYIAFVKGDIIYIPKADFGKLNWGNKIADPNSKTAVKE